MQPKLSKWKSLAPVPRPEKVLEQYYPRLCEWAVILTRGDRALSGDIVHDLYVYVALTKPDFSRVENLDNYLYQSLRHMYLSALARSSREAMQSATVADCESIQVALWMKPNRDTAQQQNDLRLICSYVVWRKPLVRGASYFILRFFHGYRIEEIAEIACVPLGVIQPRMSEVRAEVRTYLAEPYKVQTTIHASVPDPVQRWGVVSSHRLVQELRVSILDSKTGNCLSENELQRQYRSPHSKPVPTSTLSHIVSCEECLARIDAIFRRPTLKDREPLDGIDGFDGDGSDKKNQERSASGHRVLLRAAQRHRDDVFDHRPQKLAIAVDGKIVALHEVQAQRNVLSARAERAEESTFVEVFSEQGLRLAMLSLHELPPKGPHRQIQSTNLSSGRWVELTLTVDGQGLIAEVVYSDPALPAVVVSARADEEEGLSPILLEFSGSERLDADGPSVPGAAYDDAVGLEPAVSKARARVWFEALCLRLGIQKLTMNPIFTTALVLAAASAMCFLVWWHQRPSISTNTFMVRAERWDNTPSNSIKPGVIYQKVQIKTQRRTVNRGIYRDAQGVRTLRHEELDPQDAQLKEKLATADVDWNQPLSAGSYRGWHDGLQIAVDSIARVGTHLLALTTKGPDGPILEQSLTVRDSDFHPIKRTIRFRDNETIEIAELSYEELPWLVVDPNLFNPLALTEGSLTLPHDSLPLKALSTPTEGQIDEAELAARLSLNQLHADTGEQIEIVRNPSGVVVKGVVETEQRRLELVKRLYSLPHVATMLSSLERMKREQMQGAGDFAGVNVASAQSQATPLEIYYLARGRTLVLLGQLPQQLLNCAFIVGVESRAIDDLQRRFARRDDMSLVASAALTDLLFTHKHKLLAALDDEEHLLADAQIESSSSISKTSADGAEPTLTALAERNLSLARELALSSGTNERSAESIASELSASIDELYRYAHAAQVVPQNFTKLNNSK